MVVNPLTSREHVGKARYTPVPILGKAGLLPVMVLVIGALLFFTGALASAQTIIDEWATVKAPPAPALKPVTVDPKVTALLIDRKSVV